MSTAKKERTSADDCHACALGGVVAAKPSRGALARATAHARRTATSARKRWQRLFRVGARWVGSAEFDCRRSSLRIRMNRKPSEQWPQRCNRPAGSGNDKQGQRRQRDKRYAKATHNTWAAILSDGQVLKNDDGEAGAGMVIVRMLQREGLHDHMIVVTRWFSGTHLGGDRFLHVQTCVRQYLDDLQGQG